MSINPNPSTNNNNNTNTTSSHHPLLLVGPSSSSSSSHHPPPPPPHPHPHPHPSSSSSSFQTLAAPSSSSSSSRSSGQSNSACAACKYQRRKCNPDCILAPYFPADQQRQFLNAHRLFGVSNILKIIRGLDSRKRDEAMRTIIYQSNVRAMDSVGGCYRIVLELERQVELYTAELQFVLQQLAVYRAQAAAAAAPLSAELGLNVGGDNDESIYNNNLFGNNNFVPIMPHQQQQQQQQYFGYFCYDSDGENNARFNNNVIVNFNNENNFGIVGENVETMVSSSTNFQQEQMQKQLEEVKLEETLDVKPLMDVFEAGQSFIRENEEEQSSASSLCRAKMVEKEDLNTMEHVQEHDLKGAASLFTLTNGSSSAIE